MVYHSVLITATKKKGDGEVGGSVDGGANQDDVATEHELRIHWVVCLLTR